MPYQASPSPFALRLDFDLSRIVSMNYQIEIEAISVSGLAENVTVFTPFQSISLQHLAFQPELFYHVLSYFFKCIKID